MNILVINLSLRPFSPAKIFPIGLAYMATSIKNAGYRFDLLDIDANRYSDQQVEEFIRAKEYDVVCMGCIVTGYRFVKDLCEVVKRYHPEAKIIVGNSVATSIVDTLLTRTKTDFAVMGEGDETTVDILKAIEQGRDMETVSGICFLRDDQIVRTPPRSIIKNISLLPPIDYSIFDIEIYIECSKNYIPDRLPIPREEVRGLPVNTARGCVANCTFCYHVFKNVPYRFRSADSVLSEIKGMIDSYALNVICFSDELTFFSKKQALEFSEKVIESGLKFYWLADCRSDLFDKQEDIEIILKMKQAGCFTIGYALESASEDILKDMNKKSTVEQFSFQTSLFHKAELYPVTSIVIGFPQETPETIRSTFDCCIENKIYPSTGYLLPQPGSKMYDYAVEHGFIIEEEDYLMQLGDRQDLRLNMTAMTDEELEKCVNEGLQRCNKALGMGLDDSQLIKTQFYRKAQLVPDK